ncbi:MAG: UDP-N-acetylglucosamine 1-carboxyvinyltransferase [Actinobacteria bacterium]|nr:UDP-N-acetylglucosamine 1-carboxyvinyltransferase [Actinomycetota bacterium]
MSEAFRIEGGYALSGAIVPAGNKNAALPILAACLLTAEPVVLENVPDIVDVRVMLDILRALGVDVEYDTGDRHTVRVHAADVISNAIPVDLARQLRASLLLAGPLLARLGGVDLPLPGGDFIGRRRIDTHLAAFRALGADVTAGRTYVITGRGRRLVGTEIFLDEASVTATENALAAAVLADGQTKILNAACEPHVQDMANFLVTLGGEIDGIGTNRLVVTGVQTLRGGVFRIGPDHIEVASFVGLAAATGSAISIPGVRTDDLRMIALTFARLGIAIDIRDDVLHVSADQTLAIMADEGGAIPKVDDGAWPAFPADLTSIATAVATQCHGEVMIFEKMFENRLFFVDKLVAMGARIILCDPHRAVVSGPTPLYGERLESPDIRAGMAMLIASLAASGTSVIANIRQIDRGYEDVDGRLRAIGARIERIDA